MELLIQKKIRALATPERARINAGYFKCGVGQYGEGDVFLGLRTPQIRQLALEFVALPWDDLLLLLSSPYHEERLTALFILVAKFDQGNSQQQKAVFDFYREHRRWVNNWDLVDSSAHKIVGKWLYQKDTSVLATLAASPVMWDRRIAIVATWHFIKQDSFADTLRLAQALLADTEDLMHKAVGWMLREVGKRDEQVLSGFLATYAPTMPRTMLRYAIERFDAVQRKRWLEAKTLLG